jgi:hypothetical protein
VTDDLEGTPAPSGGATVPHPGTGPRILADDDVLETRRGPTTWGALRTRSARDVLAVGMPRLRITVTNRSDPPRRRIMADDLDRADGRTRAYDARRRTMGAREALRRLFNSDDE